MSRHFCFSIRPGVLPQEFLNNSGAFKGDIPVFGAYVLTREIFKNSVTFKRDFPSFGFLKNRRWPKIRHDGGGGAPIRPLDPPMNL